MAKTENHSKDIESGQPLRYNFTATKTSLKGRAAIYRTAQNNPKSYARYKQKLHGGQAYAGSGHRRMSGNPKEQRVYELEEENAELRRSNEILHEALGFSTKDRKK